MKFTNYRSSFFTKLLVLFVIVGVVPVILLGLFVNIFSYRLSSLKLEQQSTALITKAVDNMDEMLNKYKMVVDLLSKDSDFEDILTSKKIKDYDKNILSQKMFLLLGGKVPEAFLHILGSDGDFKLSTSTIPSIYNINSGAQWGLFRELSRNDGVILYSNRFVNNEGISIGLSIASVIKKDGQVLGYIIMDIPANSLKSVFTQDDNYLNMNYLIMDKYFYMIFSEVPIDNKANFFNLPFKEELLDYNVGHRTLDINGRKSIVTNLRSKSSGLIFAGEIPLDIVIQNNNFITLITTISALVALVLCLILTVLLARSFTKPIKNIVKTMKIVEKGDLNARISINRKDEFGYLALKFNDMIERLDDLFQKDLEKQDRLRLAEIKYLQAQINPHFLYNTLDSIKWLAKLNGINEISIIVSKLGNLLKNSINNNSDMMTVEESMTLIDSYLEIQQIRYNDKFKSEILIDNTIMKYTVPKLIIQPIVENAIVHGIENKIGNGIVKITGGLEGENIVFEVIDDGVGISQQKIQNLIESNTVDESSSIGLSNINNRIKLYYGDKYGIEVFSEIDKGTKVRVTMPINEDVLRR